MNGTVRYTPAAGFSGSDTFQYTTADTQGRESAVTTVTITVSPASSGAGSGAGKGDDSGGGGAASWLSLAALASLLGRRGIRARV